MTVGARRTARPVMLQLRRLDQRRSIQAASAAAAAAAAAAAVWRTRRRTHARSRTPAHAARCATTF